MAALRGDPEVAITGNKVLVLHGVRAVVDDLEMHPRTAIGIDRDTGQVLMLVVDGRQYVQPRLHDGRAGRT